ncbi:MAG: hypothetical protein HN600_03260 [Bacteroidetes bacterium]|nr:hypothetical protein [Cytophagia bacterium]MBT7825591.1 hypothetical protein [Bacteroidota bacterium]
MLKQKNMEKAHSKQQYTLASLTSPYTNQSLPKSIAAPSFEEKITLGNNV